MHLAKPMVLSALHSIMYLGKPRVLHSLNLISKGFGASGLLSVPLFPDAS